MRTYENSGKVPNWTQGAPIGPPLVWVFGGSIYVSGSVPGISALYAYVCIISQVVTPTNSMQKMTLLEMRITLLMGM